MKIVTVLLTLLVCASVSAQDWRDTLDMARSAYKLQDYKKAFKHYEKAQKGAPENLDLSDEMAQSAYKSGDYELAEKIYQQSHGSKSNAKAKADNLHNLGNSRMKSENYQGAIDAYKDALRANPNDEKTRYNLSEAMRKQKKQEEQQQKEQNQDQGSGEGNNSESGDSGDSGDQSNSGDQQSNNGDSQPKNQGDQQGSAQNGKSQGENSGQQGNKGQLSNKTADRMLDDLMKQEAETKRRMSGGTGKGGSSKSGKDW